MQRIYLETAPILPGCTVLAALLSLVLTRIVVVTALSYGLTAYALEMVIRVLVLELIPLTAALFVALRCTIPSGAALAQLRHAGHLDALRRAGAPPGPLPRRCAPCASLRWATSLRRGTARREPSASRTRRCGGAGERAGAVLHCTLQSSAAAAPAAHNPTVAPTGGLPHASQTRSLTLGVSVLNHFS